MMSFFTRKRKMAQGESKGGAVSSITCGKESKIKTSKPKFARSQKSTGTGDHNFVAYICSKDGPVSKYSMIAFKCDYGDCWRDYMSSNSYGSVNKTGDAYYDGVLGDIDIMGYARRRQLHKSKTTCILMAYCNNTHSHVAIKFLTKNVRQKPDGGEGMSIEMPDELKILRQLQHPNVIRLRTDYCIRGRVLLIFDFCENGSLDSLVHYHPKGFLTETVARSYFTQMLDAVQYLHSQSIAHRDIRLCNFLVDRHNALKLCGFAQAIQQPSWGEVTYDRLPTTSYSAPEIYLTGVCAEGYTPSLLDMWSMGACLYIMVTGELPFPCYDHPRERGLWLIERGVKFPEKRVLPLDKSLRDILRGLLQLTPSERYTINRVRHADWLAQASDAVAIGNFYLLQQPQKVYQGARETELKKQLNI